MHDNYGKAFGTTFTGSMYGAGLEVFAVWFWVLANKDENGHLEINPILVANVLGGVAQQVEDAVEYLCAPDPNSRSKERGGRRLVKVSQFGYEVVNDEKYRGRGGSRKEYWREYRRQQKVLRNSCATVCATDRTHTEADTNTKVVKESDHTGPTKKARKPKASPERTQNTPLGGWDRFWDAWPKKVAKRDARRAFDKLAPLPELLETILAAVVQQKQSKEWLDEDGMFIPNPAKWLKGERWTDQLPEAPKPDKPTGALDDSHDPNDEQAAAWLEGVK